MRSPAGLAVTRNAATRGGTSEYRALVAQWKAQQVAKRPKVARSAINDRLRDYNHERLSGHVRRPDGRVVARPQPPPWKGLKKWKGLNKPHRPDRRWALAWSPEQISHRLKFYFPDDKSMRISHEAIYQSLFIEAAAHSNANWSPACEQGTHYASPEARHGIDRKGISLQTSCSASVPHRLQTAAFLGIERAT